MIRRRLPKIALLIILGAALNGALTTSAADAPPATSPGAAPATKPDASGPAKFYGAVSAVDTKAMTFTIDNQVYTVVPETQMTKAADNSKATLADAVVGEPARGTYTKSDDGKRNVTKVRFGKKTGGKGGGKKKTDATTQPQEK